MPVTSFERRWFELPQKRVTLPQEIERAETFISLAQPVQPKKSALPGECLILFAKLLTAFDR
jgi:hypothetical protein